MSPRPPRTLCHAGSLTSPGVVITPRIERSSTSPQKRHLIAFFEIISPHAGQGRRSSAAGAGPDSSSSLKPLVGPIGASSSYSSPGGAGIAGMSMTPAHLGHLARFPADESAVLSVALQL